MMTHSQVARVVSLALLTCGYGQEASKCATLARTEAGWVCGATRLAHDGSPYASFRGVPYAKQPLGELRFKELQPLEPWEGVFNATVEGPICPQHGFYGPLMSPQGVSEACICANVHVAAAALPHPRVKAPTSRGLPILVFTHGGAWIAGSGDSDLQGPEYLVSKGMVVITFNYRLDIFGFLSLNTTKIPGNNGLRDMVELLRWVQRNAHYFGGDPENVTLMGHSAGSASAHLLSLSPVTKGLFKRLWLKSGTALPSFHSTSPAFARQLADTFLTLVGLNGTDYDTVHDQLVQMPLEVILKASGTILERDITSFSPVVESPLPNVTAIITDDPETLIANGVGNDIPLVIGYTSNEAESTRPIIVALNMVERHKDNPLAMLPHQLLTLPSKAADKVRERYSSEDPRQAEENMVSLMSDNSFIYPALRLARTRGASGGAPVHLYKFSYVAEHSVYKIGFNITFEGATHGEDQNRIFKFNAFPMPYSEEDQKMSDWMTDIVADYVKTGKPVPHSHLWPHQTTEPLGYQEFIAPYKYIYHPLTCEEQDVVEFFDDLYHI